MLRLISIEYFKLRHTKYFWVLLILFLIFLLAVPIGSKIFVDYLSSIGENITDLNIAPDELPLFDFVDIWQNLTWVYSIFSILLGFIAVISITNEFNFNTVKQNVIDGLSRKQFLYSKVGFMVALSFVVSLAVLIVGLIMGFLWSPVKQLPFILKNLEFIPAYFLHLIGFQLFCMVVALLIKRSGITIALLIFYRFVIEPIATGVINYHYKLPWLADLFPVRGLGVIIRNPFPKYILQETQTFISLGDLAIVIGYTLIFFFLAKRVITRRDLS